MDISVPQSVQNLLGAPMGIIIAVGVIVLTSVYALLLGKDKIMSILFGTYISFGLTYIFPYHIWMGNVPISKLVLAKFVLFVTGVIVFSIIIILSHSVKGDLGHFLPTKFLRGASFGIAQIGLFVSLSLAFLPPEWFLKIPSKVSQIFIDPTTQFIWFILPIVVILIFKQKKHRGPGRPALYD